LAVLGTIAAAVTGHHGTASASALTGGYRAIFYVTAAILATAFLVAAAALPLSRQHGNISSAARPGTNSPIRD
jgi:hypothetical protein